MHPLSQLGHGTRLHRFRLACIAATAMLLRLGSMGHAQDVSPNAPFGESIGFLQDSVVPASFVSKATCKGCGSPATCSGCGSCALCCSCGGHMIPWYQRWEGGFDIGLTGAEGATRDLNMVVGFDAKRKWGLNTASMDFDYFFDRESSQVTKNRAYMLGRYERDIPDSPWGMFADAWLEYDQFEEWRSRVGLHLGASVLLQDSDCCTLKGRVGVGSSKKQRGPDRDWKPEGLLGADYELRLTSRQKFKTTVDYYPDVGDVKSFRLNTRAGWELLIDEEADLSLSLSAFDRYDSTPAPGDVANELDYWLSLHWGF